ncbi:ubiquinol-cytochrome c reductase iron-sulfur subunit [Streptomyces sp. NPDC048337]|uniref:QcrA and Rieske domain-containing protein n=1 Tax=Streptomyces sp. NPDC048337 TaxID=3365535 RepID=UPI003717A1F2
MSVTEQPPPAPGEDEAADRLRDRISADSLTTRRDYLRIVATVSGGLAIGGVGVAAGILHRHGDSETLPPAKKVTDRLAPGESVAFRFPGDEDRALAVRLADGTLVGYSAVCTHLACAVLWREDRGVDGELYCPCHEGVFDVRTGEVSAGPPPRPLPIVFLTEQADGSVWAIATARSGESAKDALCRQFGDSRPETTRQLGCPGADRATANESGRT